MSDPLLPVPDPGIEDQEGRPDDEQAPDVLEGPADDAEGVSADEPGTAPAETPFQTPVAGGRLTADELREDLRGE